MKISTTTQESLQPCTMHTRIVFLLLASVLLCLNLFTYDKPADAHEKLSSVTARIDEPAREISESDFQKLALNSSKPVLIDFYANWCFPCKKLAPIIADVSRKYSGRVSFYRVDVEKNSSLAARYRVEGIPALKVFKNGKVIAERTGLQSIDEISAMLDRALLSQ